MRNQLYSLAFANFIIGTGTFIVAGLLNELSSGLQVSVSAAGQLLSGYSFALAISAPLLAWITTRIDRRTLIVTALTTYGVFHFLATAFGRYDVLMVLRVLTGIAAAIVTPQAVAAAGLMVEPAQRGRAITTVFLGFSLSTVIGVPLGTALGAAFGWRIAFDVVGVAALLAALWVWRALPPGLMVAPMDGRAWKSLAANTALLLVVITTVLHAAGQFTLYTYLAPVAKAWVAATPTMIVWLFAWFGFIGVIGNLLASRVIDRVGAPRVILASLASMAIGIALWPLTQGSLTITIVALFFWGLGCFAINASQQARLVAMAPNLASASVALNSSGIYMGQAIGGVVGGTIISQAGYAPLSYVGLIGLAAALITTTLATRLNARAVRNSSSAPNA